MRSLRSLRVLPSLLFTAALAACSSSSNTPGRAGTPGVTVAMSSVQREVAPVVSASDQAAVVQGNTAFALDLFKVLHPGSANLFFSPYSISSALAMVYAGASGTTATEMASALHYTLPPAQLHPAFDWLDLELAKRGSVADGTTGDPVQLHVANSFWGFSGDTFEPPFLDTLARDYGAAVRQWDFAGQPEGGRAAINEWVSGQTNAKIPELIPEGGIDTLTRAVLVDAIDFQASWRAPFAAGATKDGPFTRAAGGSVSAPLMALGMENLPYGEGDGYQAIELAYVGEQVAMDVVLPTAGTEAAFLDGLDAAKVSAIVASIQPAPYVSVTLPKFTIPGVTTDLALALETMGMRAAFDGAGLTEMTATEVLKLKSVFHQAFIGVDEQGTVAAAASAGVAQTLSLPTSMKTFTANRPFYFMIRDVPTGTILFAGWLADPS